MRIKHAILGLLVVVNLVLAVALLATVVSPRAAFAQPPGADGNVIAITANVRSNFDGVYLLDTDKRTLLLFVPRPGEVGRTQLSLVAARDLKRDFRQ
jgi:hypothetical protein